MEDVLSRLRKEEREQKEKCRKISEQFIAHYLMLDYGSINERVYQTFIILNKDGYLK